MLNGLVSVIVPVYNTERFLKDSIDGILNQTYSKIEVVVVYDESTDNTLEILEGYGDRIKLIKQGKTNPATARNRGIKESSGEYIAFCDADDMLDKTRIEKQISVLEDNQNIGLCYTDNYFINVEGDIIDEKKSPEWDRKTWLRSRFIVFSSVLMRRSVIDLNYKKYSEIFDVSLGGCEDFDFLIRMSEFTEFKRLPETLTYLRLHPDSLCRNTLWKMNMVKLHIFKKYGLTMEFAHSMVMDFPKGYISEKIIKNKYYKE